MNKNINRMKYLFTILFSLLVLTTQAQEVEMADAMRSDGKIYVVLAIVLFILIGLIAYLFLLDRKITRLEKEIRNK